MAPTNNMTLAADEKGGKEKKKGKNVPVNPPDKNIRCEKSHRARQKAIHGTSEQAVAEEEEAGDEALDVKSGEKEPNAVEEDPEGATGAGEDGLPPPVVVLFGGF